MDGVSVHVSYEQGQMHLRGERNETRAEVAASTSSLCFSLQQLSAAQRLVGLGVSLRHELEHPSGRFIEEERFDCMYFCCVVLCCSVLFCSVRFVNVVVFHVVQLDSRARRSMSFCGGLCCCFCLWNSSAKATILSVLKMACCLFLIMNSLGSSHLFS